MMVVMAASTAVSVYQSGKERDAAESAAKKQEKLAREAEENQLAALDAQLEQETDKTQIAKLDRQRQALRERAKIRVAASEAGGLGNTTIKELSASFMGEGYDKGLMDYNLRAKKDQIRRGGEAVKINTKRDIANQKARIPLSTPTWMQGLNIGLAGAKGYVGGSALGTGGKPGGSGSTEPTPYIPAK
jgi:hypothetical protein